MSNHLQSDRVNLALIQDQARLNLLQLLKKCEGTKAIFWDKSLESPLSLIITYKLLLENDVNKMFFLDSNSIQNNPKVKHIVFITRPQLRLMDLISQHVAEHSQSNSNNKEYHIIFVPNQSLICLKHLQEHGVYGSFSTINQLECLLFPIDSDVVSMELNNSFRDYHLDRDPTCLFQAAQALRYIQQLYGPIRYIWGKGHAAQNVWDLTKRLCKESSFEKSTLGSTGGSAIDQLLILDRSIDFISPLATQLTYEGLIDEIFGINCTFAHFPADKFPSPDEPVADIPVSDTKKITLNSSNELFAELRDKNFNAVGTTLSKQAKSISSQFEERHGDKTVQEMRQFVAKLPNMLANKQAVATHTTIAECIKEITDSNEFIDTLQTEQEFLNCIDSDKICPFIEELISLKTPLVKVLRLICFQCATNSGFKPKILEFYKRELIQVYGLGVLLTITNLEKAGLLYTQSTSRHYAVLRKSLRLTMEDTSETDPTDISYVHSVYAPLSIRIAENLCKPRGWRQLQDVLGLLSGPTFEEIQPISYLGQQSSGTSRRNSLSSEISQFDTPKIILVFFIGGCTYAEISALRFLSQQEDVNYEFIVATTKLINGNTLIESLIEPLSS